MTALVILAAVVLALVLLGQIRLGAAVDYTAQGPVSYTHLTLPTT